MATRAPVTYEAVIGLEVHAHLATASKKFCRCDTDNASSAPNTYVCPVCMGMPGVLPVINRTAVEFTVMTGLALNCRISEHSHFDRKNYLYPDLMKGYQISQSYEPFCRDGWLEIEVDGAAKKVGISDVHLEEDTARLVHRVNEAGDGYSLVDVNRAGVPLIEIVSRPDMRSAEEARQYVVRLQQILRYLGVSTANMEEGSMRCEPSVSLRPAGQSEFGTRVEVKNINSFRAVFRAVEYEIERQRALLEAGGHVAQETVGWREEEGRTVSQRSKEYAHDYRYFPEPDLPPVHVTTAEIDALRARLPELPMQRRARLVDEYGLTPYEADLLTESRERADYFQAALAASGASGDAETRRAAKSIANWMLGELARLLNASAMDITVAKVSPEQLCAMIRLVEDGTISGKIAKTVFEEMFNTGKPAARIVEELGLRQISSSSQVEEVVDRVIAGNPRPVDDYRSGKQEALRFLVGQVMKETRGQANPELANEILRRKLDGAQEN